MPIITGHAVEGTIASANRVLSKILTVEPHSDKKACFAIIQMEGSRFGKQKS
jgi:hypothetical protein